MPLEGHGRRLQGWDYSKGASFFITLSLEERRPLFGHIVCGKMCLNDFGWKVLHALEEIPRIHPEISLFGHVVMPDHVHFNCHLAAGLPDPLKLLGRAIAGFKAYTTRLPHAQCACGSAPAPEVEAQTHRACATSAYSAHTPLHSSAQSGGASAPRLRWWRLG